MFQFGAPLSEASSRISRFFNAIEAIRGGSRIANSLGVELWFFLVYNYGLSAESGKEAIQLFAEHRPPLVITDWLMPDVTGIELCQRIRLESQESYTYIII